jgi:hypothetical protein
MTIDPPITPDTIATMTAIARHHDNTTSKWDSILDDRKEFVRQIREAILEETGKEPYVVLVRVK